MFRLTNIGFATIFAKGNPVLFIIMLIGLNISLFLC